MSADVFLSYAWTSDAHRQWVRLLAANLKAIGYDVLVDADVDYGDSLNGFMQRAVGCRHVLLIVDENYVERADNLPDSGVGIENGWIKGVYAQKPSTWLSVMFKDNPGSALPAWVSNAKPKGLSFNADSRKGTFPGSEQVEELWRWIEGLPANRDHATSIAILRERGVRLETIDRYRDPAMWAAPATEGEVTFEYERAPGNAYRLGHGEYGFALHVSTHAARSVYVYKDPIHAVGLNLSKASSPKDLAPQLTPGRTIIASVGQQAILMNDHGALCLVDLLDVHPETTQPAYTPASIRFRYSILTSS
ncbi:toll/interleukin-1 receptor domain-containing protein [Micrococcus luteus]|uniref:toll/interleukin-1 receptor domain-containing protein n=1 Tax=Micrococcus luteus TaxID=1270 RepID=UPI0010ADCA4E|nr:toll/interleukin-1 receptor domain-containing protein [Micrococcus luteus]TKD65600.1 toll/interleukin-1 receptor domain-containing protein [Micrococcus luteus]